MITTIIIGILGGIMIFSFMIFQKKRKEIALSVISFGIAILISEILLRIFLPQIDQHNKMFEYDPTLGWRFIPNSKAKVFLPGGIQNSVETNSLGFRDHTPSSNKNKKLLVLGDSFVSNISLKDEDVFTEIMEDQLQNYDVLNFGVNGYGQVQEYLLLKKWFAEINPDVIILTIYLRNDFTDNMGNYWLYSRPYASLEGEDSILTIHQEYPRVEYSESSWDFLSKSHLYTLLKRTLNEQRPHSIYDPLYSPPELLSCRWPVSRDCQLMFHITEELLLKIADYAKEKHVPVAFVLVPSIVQVEDEVWASFLEKYTKTHDSYIRLLPNNRLMQLAKKNNLLMLDLFPLLHQESEKHIKLYNTLEQHWTKEGNRVVSHFLLDYLKSNSLIE